VQGSGFSVQGSGFRVQGLRFRGQVLGAVCIILSCVVHCKVVGGTHVLSLRHFFSMSSAL